MDALDRLLDGPRALGAFLLRVVMEPPWSMRIEDEAPVAVLPILGGQVWLDPLDGGAPACLVAGDLLIARGPEHYVVSSEPGLAHGIVVEPGGRCVALDGTPLVHSMSLGVRTWGNCAEGPDTFLVGAYFSEGQVSRWLLDAMPRLIVLRGRDWTSPTIGVLDAEMRRNLPGQRVLLDRLLDALLVSALREAFTVGTWPAPAWFGAGGDPVVAEAVRLMQDAPDEPWTVAGLAARVGVSRALFARRFTEVVGEPPMAFLTRWRMALAADLMLEREATVTSVAGAVGYSSPFTFSTAFKRVHGRSPRAYRDAQLAS
jgi:AraC-like DNA-binding protein